METAITSVFAWEALDSRGTPTVGCEVGLRCGARGVAYTCPRARRRARTRRASCGTEANATGGRAFGGPSRRSTTCSARRLWSWTRPTGVARRRPSCARWNASRSSGSAPTQCWPCRWPPRSPPRTLPGSRCTGTSSQEPRPLLPLPMVNVDLRRRARARQRRRRAGLPRRPGRRLDLRGGDRVVPAGSHDDRGAWRSRRGHPASLVADEGGLGLPLASNRAASRAPARRHRTRRARAGRGGRRSQSTSPPASSQPNPALPAEHGGSGAHGRRAHRRARAWCNDFPIVSLEDPLGEDDWAGWAARHRSSAGHPGRRRRPVRNPDRPPRARHCRRRRERRPPEAEPVRDASRARARPSFARAPPDTRPSSPRARATRRTPGSPTSQSAGARPDQGRLHHPIRAHGEVEPAAADRGRGGDRGRVCRPASAGDVTDVVCLGLLVADAIARPSIRPTRSVSRRPRAGGTRPGAAARAGSRGRRRPPCRSRARGPSGSALPRPAPRRA